MLSLVMSICLLPALVSADGEQNDQPAGVEEPAAEPVPTRTEVFTDDTVTYTFYCYDNSYYPTKVVISGTGTITRTGFYLGYNTFSFSYIENVVIEDGITAIADKGENYNGVFQNCSELKSITLPDSLTYIGDYAFANLNNLESIVLPSHLVSLGDDAFYACENLTSITLPNGLEHMGAEVFYYCIGLESIIIPDSVTYIGNDAFHSCENLTSVTIPASLTRLENGIFQNCPKLEQVVFPQNSALTSVGRNAFNVTALTSITLPDTVEEIGDNAFSGSSSLAQINIPSSLRSFGNNAFGSTKIKEFTIPDGFTEIPASLFSSCSELTTINIPSSVIRIGDRAFSGCKKLTTINYSGHPVYIGEGAFGSCEKLTAVPFSQYASYIGPGAFERCYGLTEIVLNNELEYLGDSAFMNCTNLESMNIPYRITELRPYIFNGCTSLTSVTVTDNLTVIQNTAFRGIDPTITYVSSPEHRLTGIDYWSFDLTDVTDNHDGTWSFKVSEYVTSPVYITPIYEIANETCARLVGHSLTLDGSIGVNFFMELTESTISDPEAHIEFTLPDGTTESVYVSGNDANRTYATTREINNKTYYVFSCHVSAKEMTAAITADFYCTQDDAVTKIKTYTYSVVDYAYYVLNDDSTSYDLKELIVAMLKYGAAAQNYFGYNTGTLATIGLYRDYFEYYGNYDLSNIDPELTRYYSDLPSDIEFYGTALSLRSETSMKLYFINNTGSELTFTLEDGTPLIPTVDASGYTIVTVEGISASDLDTLITVRVNDTYSLSVSPLLYCYNVATREGGIYTDSLKELVRRLYSYNVCANAYFA